jgi:hypothetical protein
MAYTHAVCKRDFDSQGLLDAHVASPLLNPVCRLNEGSLLIKGFNY